MHKQHSILVENRRMIHAFNDAFSKFEYDVVKLIQSEKEKLDLNSRDRETRSKIRVFLDNVSILAQFISLYLGKYSWRT